MLRNLRKSEGEGRGGCNEESHSEAQAKSSPRYLGRVSRDREYPKLVPMMVSPGKFVCIDNISCRWSTPGPANKKDGLSILHYANLYLSRIVSSRRFRCLRIFISSAVHFRSKPFLRRCTVADYYYFRKGLLQQRRGESSHRRLGRRRILL